MTTLIQGHTVLKSTPVIMSGSCTYRYRITATDDGFTVHVECREPNGACGEQFLYQGQSVTTANYVFDRYSKN
jgi:hypothetical protein